MNRTLQILVGVSVMVLLVLPETGVGCPVCFGATESARSTESVRMAILVLLGVTGVVLSLVGAFFAYVRKRLKMTMNGTFDYPNLN